MSDGRTLRQFDVVGVGIVAVDELLWVARYPAADAKIPVLRRARRCGGLNATALVAAARLGARVAYAGVLGTDEPSAFALDALRSKGVDTGHVWVHPDAGPVQSVIVLDEAEHTRTIFYDLERMIDPDPAWLPRELVAGARVLLVDDFRLELALRAAAFARSAGVAVVADLEGATSPRLLELIDLVDHLIVPHRFATAVTGEPDAAGAARALRAEGRTVVVTCGEQGSWYAPDPSTEPRHQPAFRMEVVDTNGCGDVFHGAYAAALAQGVPLPERVLRASAVAALAARTPGGQEGIPDAQELASFLGR